MTRNSRVVHVSSAHPYTDNRIHYREASTLARVGFDVLLIAVESDVDGPESAVRVSLLPKRRRLARMILSPMQAVRRAVASRAQIVHLHDPELIPYIPVLKLLGRTVIYDAHEDLPTQMLNKPYLNPMARRLLSGFARVLVGVSRLSDLTICATETIAVRHRGKNVSVVRNYPPLREEDSLSAEDVLERPRRIVYIGSLGRGRGVQTSVDAMQEAKMPTGWELSLAGIAPDSVLSELRASPGWSRVDYHGQLAPQAARDLLLTARIGLCVLADTPAYRDAMPTKMFEYLAAGIPVIASDFPLWRSIVADAECALFVAPDSPGEIASAVKRYAEDPELLKEHSVNARRLANEKLNWAREADTLIAAYESVR